MKASQFFLQIGTFFALVSIGLTCNGCVSLDQYNFQKLINRFKLVLVKFDVAYPYGDKHEAFAKIAEEFASNMDILVGQVGIKDYGEKENEELGRQNGITSKDDLPVVKLFEQGKEPVDFPKGTAWSVESLRNFVRDNTNLYIGLPGCLEKYDHLAMDFVNSKNKESKLKEAESLVESEQQEEKQTAKTYILFMKKIIEQGVKFVKQEITRLNKIVSEGKVQDKKKEELAHRLNILHSFSISIKDEL